MFKSKMNQLLKQSHSHPVLGTFFVNSQRYILMVDWCL